MPSTELKEGKSKITSPQIFQSKQKTQIKYTYKYLRKSKNHGREHRIVLNLHTGVKWQEMLPPFNRGGLSLTSAALFVSQWSGKA